MLFLAIFLSSNGYFATSFELFTMKTHPKKYLGIKNINAIFNSIQTTIF